jgi:multidrug efflux pump subunit AcrA (membrane-fusion protein)
VTPSVTVTVRPQVSGVITQVLFTEGQLVKKGQVLATIDPRSYEIALQQAIGARMRDEAQLENAKVLLQRYQTLLSQDSIARQDVDTQRAAVRQLEATLVIDRANENTARLNLAYTRIVAPVGRSDRLARGRRRQPDQRQRLGRPGGDHADRAHRRRVLGAAGPRPGDPGARRRRCQAAR